MSKTDGSRRSFLTTVARSAGGAAVGGIAWTYLVHQQAQATPFALRPPGALDEPEFISRCIKCGQCVTECPFDTLDLARVGDSVPVGTPHFIPRDVPCYMCPDIPCVKACPTGALDPVLVNIDDADIGLAVVVDQENCLSYRGLRCEICHRDCPLQDRAITIVRQPRKLSKHAVFVPIIHSDSCTGCGICEKSCPLPESAIKVLPHKLAQGKLGEHYRFGWTEDTAITQEFDPAAQAPMDAGGDVEAGIDYLNEEIP